jgi:hypothetical protein
MACRRSPYLKDNRLGDVLAAIQAMGPREDRYSGSCDAWAQIISYGSGRDANYWKVVFDEHGEFFREGRERDDNQRERLYALIWRMAFKDEPTKTPRRRVLAPEEVKLLCDIAINMHAKAIEGQRWFVAPVLSFVGSLVGAFIGFAAAGLFRGAHL